MKIANPKFGLAIQMSEATTISKGPNGYTCFLYNLMHHLTTLVTITPNEYRHISSKGITHIQKAVSPLKFK